MFVRKEEQGEQSGGNEIKYNIVQRFRVRTFKKKEINILSQQGCTKLT